MNRIRSLTLAGIAGAVLTIAPISSAFAQHRHHHYGLFWPIAAAATLTAAVVGTAAAVITAPLALVAAAANAPYAYYREPYVGPAAVFNGAPAYSAAPVTYYEAPARTVYAAPPSPVYYAPPVRYYAPAPVYYAPPARYYYRY